MKFDRFRARLDTSDKGFEERFARLIAQASGGAPKKIAETVSSIIAAVADKDGGESALLRLVRRLDKFDCKRLEDLELPAEQVRAGARLVPKGVRAALEHAAARIGSFHRREASTLKEWRMRDGLGNEMGMRPVPAGRAAVYVPGGRALYPSTVLMNAIPAREAGVGEVAMFTPPGKGGKIDPALLCAASLAGVDRVFRIGGAQAIAAAAHGNGLVPRADVIVGPGNAYVAEAKRQVFGLAGIDSVAGPSEVLIVSDSSVAPDWVAADLMAQAEHDPMARAMLLSTDEAHIRAVERSIAKRIGKEPRGKVIAQALIRNGWAAVARDRAECLALTDRVAPEHLQLMGADADWIAKRVRNAGAVFVGAHSSAVLGDYCAGTNHVLPTGGNARHSSPLGVRAFVKWTSMLKASPKGGAELARTAIRLAGAEGLPAHSRSAALRRNMSR